MAQPLPGREWLERFAEAAAAYRTAFRDVQRILRDTDMGRIPQWCFAIDGISLDELAKLDTDLASAERERRRWRVALHALSELIALNGESEPQLSHPDGSDSQEELIESLGDTGDVELDRFITVINYAKSGGVIYINGTFEPIKGGQKPPTTAPTSAGDTESS
jgi:hypothetical protein